MRYSKTIHYNVNNTAKINIQVPLDKSWSENLLTLFKTSLDIDHNYINFNKYPAKCLFEKTNKKFINSPPHLTISDDKTIMNFTTKPGNYYGKYHQGLTNSNDGADINSEIGFKIWSKGLQPKNCFNTPFSDILKFSIERLDELTPALDELSASIDNAPHFYFNTLTCISCMYGMSINNVFGVDPFLQTRFDVIQGINMLEALDERNRRSILDCLDGIARSLPREFEGEDEIQTLLKVRDALNEIKVNCLVSTTSGDSTKLTFNGLECFKGKEKMNFN